MCANQDPMGTNATKHVTTVKEDAPRQTDTVQIASQAFGALKLVNTDVLLSVSLIPVSVAMGPVVCANQDPMGTNATKHVTTVKEDATRQTDTVQIASQAFGALRLVNTDVLPTVSVLPVNVTMGTVVVSESSSKDFCYLIAFS
ncbi:uncharacterized protein [Littorina saxatilis]|uniref:uncharacterized protein n=1 Tax=Littorina saxatilis TaxID=31220 RepID=UPI0038B6AF99